MNYSRWFNRVRQAAFLPLEEGGGGKGATLLTRSTSQLRDPSTSVRLFHSVSNVGIRFAGSRPAACLHLAFDILRRRACRVTFGVCRRQVRDARVTPAPRRGRASRHRFCIQTYAKGREFSSFVSLLDQLLFVLVNFHREPSFTAARNDSSPLGKIAAPAGVSLPKRIGG